MNPSAPLVQEKSTLLSDDDPDPVGFQYLDSPVPFVLLCDHSGNLIPKSRHQLGLTPDLLTQHIALDIGIFGVCQYVSDRLKSPFIFQRYSRLLIDCNRHINTPYSILEDSDSIRIPGNQNINDNERLLRQQEIFFPYHHTIENFLNQRQAKKLPTIILALHSFTPILHTEKVRRIWDIGLLYTKKDPFIESFLTLLRKHDSLKVGDNEPYSMHQYLARYTYTLPVHTQKHNLPYTGIEIRQDLITDSHGQKKFGKLLVNLLQQLP